MKTLRRGLAIILTSSMLLCSTACSDTSANSVPAPGSLPSPPEKSYNLRIGTTGVGGVYYLVGTAWAQTLAKHRPNVKLNVEITGGAVGNLQLFGTGELDLPMSISNVIVEAEGGGTQSFPHPIHTNAITAINQGALHIVASKSSGIQSIEDIRGKRVSTGEPGHSTEVIAQALLEALGIDAETDINRQRLNLTDSMDALADGRCDLVFYMGGAPVPAVQEATTTAGTGRLIPVDSAVLDRVHELYPYLVAGAIPAETCGNPEPSPTVCATNLLLCSPEMEDELVYTIVKTIHDNAAEWRGAHSSVAGLTPETAVVGSPVDFHPGAIRYYKEKGVWADERPQKQ